MREKTIEQKLVQSVKARGGLCPKLVCPGMAGMPDRLVLLPGGKMGFVEVKAPGEKPRPLQTARHRILSWLGYRVYGLDDIGQVNEIVEEIRSPAPSVTAVTDSASPLPPPSALRAPSPREGRPSEEI